MASQKSLKCTVTGCETRRSKNNSKPGHPDILLHLLPPGADTDPRWLEVLKVGVYTIQDKILYASERGGNCINFTVDATGGAKPLSATGSALPFSKFFEFLTLNDAFLNLFSLLFHFFTKPSVFFFSPAAISPTIVFCKIYTPAILSGCWEGNQAI